MWWFERTQNLAGHACQERSLAPSQRPFASVASTPILLVAWWVLRRLACVRPSLGSSGHGAVLLSARMKLARGLRGGIRSWGGGGSRHLRTNSRTGCFVHTTGSVQQVASARPRRSVMAQPHGLGLGGLTGLVPAPRPTSVFVQVVSACASLCRSATAGCPCTADCLLPLVLCPDLAAVAQPCEFSRAWSLSCQPGSAWWACSAPAFATAWPRHPVWHSREQQELRRKALPGQGSAAFFHPGAQAVERGPQERERIWCTCV